MGFEGEVRDVAFFSFGFVSEVLVGEEFGSRIFRGKVSVEKRSA